LLIQGLCREVHNLVVVKRPWNERQTRERQQYGPMPPYIPPQSGSTADSSDEEGGGCHCRKERHETESNLGRLTDGR
jgi:hypothetical protein